MLDSHNVVLSPQGNGLGKSIGCLTRCELRGLDHVTENRIRAGSNSWNAFGKCSGAGVPPAFWGSRPVFSRARRPFIAGRRPAPLFFRHALSLTNSADDISGFRPQPGMGSLPQSTHGGGTATNGKWRLLDQLILDGVVSQLGVAHHAHFFQDAFP